MLRLTTGIQSENCVVRRFHRCANVIGCTYTKLCSTVQHTTHLGYTVQPIAPRLQTCTACYCTEYCRQLKHNGKYYNTYYNLMGLPSYVGSIVDRNVVVRHIRVVNYVCQVISKALYSNGFARVNFICEGQEDSTFHRRMNKLSYGIIS